MEIIAALPGHLEEAIEAAHQATPEALTNAIDALIKTAAALITARLDRWRS